MVHPPHHNYITLVTVITVHNTIRLTRLTIAVSVITGTKAATKNMGELDKYYKELQESLEAVQDLTVNLVQNDTILPGTSDGESLFMQTMSGAAVSPITAIIITILVLCCAVKLVRSCRKRVCGCLPNKTEQPVR